MLAGPNSYICYWLSSVNNDSIKLRGIAGKSSNMDTQHFSTYFHSHFNLSVKNNLFHLQYLSKE
jgi:hypothetical protein